MASNTPGTINSNKTEHRKALSNIQHTDHTITLRDGRTLGYARFGPEGGRPVFYCHGNFGSRMDPAMLPPQLLERHRVQIIAPDRPGIGLSTFQKKRTVADWPADIAALADALNIERFAMLGISGGSPFTAACAQHLGTRLAHVAIISGVAPLHVKKWEGMGVSATYFRMARRSPLLVSLLLAMTRWGLRNEDVFLERASSSMPGPDRDALLNNSWARRGFLATMHASLSSGLKGLAYDAMLIGRPWNIDLQAIAVPVHLWHGEADENAPPAMGQYLARAIPNSHLTMIPGEGHFSLAVNHFDAILQEATAAVAA